MRHAEMLFFVYDDQPQPREFDGLCQQSMRADDNIDSARFQPLFGFCGLRCANQTRQFGDFDGHTDKTLSKSFGVLARQKRGWRDDGHLLARHGGNKGGAQAYFGLTKADITANQAVHRSAAGQIINHRLNGINLIFGFFKRKTCREFIIETDIRCHHLAVAHGALRRGFYQFICNEFDFFLEPRFAHLPSDTADFIERHRHIIAAKAAQQFDIFNRQEKSRVAVINQL